MYILRLLGLEKQASPIDHPLEQTQSIEALRGPRTCPSTPNVSSEESLEPNIGPSVRGIVRKPDVAHSFCLR